MSGTRSGNVNSSEAHSNTAGCKHSTSKKQSPHILFASPTPVPSTYGSYSKLIRSNSITHHDYNAPITMHATLRSAFASQPAAASLQIYICWSESSSGMPKGPYTASRFPLVIKSITGWSVFNKQCTPRHTQCSSHLCNISLSDNSWAKGYAYSTIWNPFDHQLPLP